MPKSTLKDFYDSLYERSPSVFGVSTLNFVKKIDQNLFLSGGCALDIGSGEGLAARYFANLGLKVDAIDLSKNAFSAISDDERITKLVMQIQDFKPVLNYAVVLFALTAHHIEPDSFRKLVDLLQNHTIEKGIHCYRLFTTNGEFFKQSGNSRFFDDGFNLDDVYKDWNIVHDQLILSSSATTKSLNEVREVVYQKV